MPEKEVKLSGLLHLPDVSSRENLITYKRRRLTNKSSKPEEVNSQNSELSETLIKWKIKRKGRDMGWAHGKMIDGNRQHWQCNWCGLTRYGGGVTRLKRHLAGDLDVRQCPNVPFKVISEVRRHLLMSDMKLKKKKKEMMEASTSQENPDMVKMVKERNEAASTENDEGKEENLCKKNKLSESQKVALEQMLKMPDGSVNGGVQTCIPDVLSLLNGSIQVDSGSMTKWGQALVDILSNDKFGLLCTLLYSNFGDGKDHGSYFDFSQINTCMKEGKYDSSPQLFRHDIQKVWEKFQKIGHEMVDLATSLSFISTAAIDKLIESTELDNSRKDPKVSPPMPVRKLSAQSNSVQMLTSSDLDQPLDDVEHEPSQNDISDNECCKCSYCNLPIGEWEHIQCTGCNLTYHLACVNPFTDDGTLNNTWYCSACVGARSTQSITEENHLISNNSPENLVGTDSSEVCKICKGPEKRGEALLTCGRKACPDKYYHMTCLKKSQRPYTKQAKKQCWYCPSCLCHTCLDNKDDYLLLSCDGCNKAHHIYCMDTRRYSVANGKYCYSCRSEKEREGLRNQRRDNEPEHMEVYGPMKMLICALESLEGQETLVN